MSEDGHTLGAQAQSENADTNNGGPSRVGTCRNPLQLETIEVLNGILANFTAQCTSMHDTCHFLATALDENPSLTPEQCSKTFDTYGGHLEEAFVT